jgi:hypothetical protein
MKRFKSARVIGSVRILRPIVEAFVLTMFDTGHDLALCAAIRA